MHMGLAIFVMGTSVSANRTRMKRPLSESCVPVNDYILTKIGCGSTGLNWRPGSAAMPASCVIKPNALLSLSLLPLGCIND